MATIIYDAEVFPYNWMFGFKILETGEIVQIWDDFDAISNFVKEHKKSFWIGFNSLRYDDIILDTVLKGIHPYDISCRVIETDEKIYSRLRLNRMDIAEGLAMGTSLKTLESEMGMSIEESDIDFKIDRELTQEEKEKTNKYNKHDLDATEKLLGHRWSNFVKTKMDLIGYFKLQPSMMQKPLATMVATGLGAKRATHPKRHFKWYDDLIIETPSVKKFLINEEYLDESLTFDLAGVEHTIGLGGIHAARQAYSSEKFWKVDVKGYYSLIQMNKNLLSRSLSGGGEKYNELYFERLNRKAAGDPSADSLKAAILAVWGATLNQYQLLFDADTGNLIMVTGQAFIIDLIEKLEPYMKLIQSNTDGIFIEPFEGAEEDCHRVIDEWVKRTGFEVEIDIGTKLFQKDVNNYVCLLNGKPEAKGAYVNMYAMQDNKKFFEHKLTYNKSQGTIVDKAIVNYFLYDIPVEKTINEEMNPRSFMYTISKGSKSYSHVEVHKEVLGSPDTEITKVSNVNRVFASKDPVNDIRIYKVKNGTPNIFPRLDINVFLFNQDLSEWTDLEWEKIDRQYYIDVAHKKISDFITPKKETKSAKSAQQIKFRIFATDIKTKTPEIDHETLVEIIKELDEGETRVGDLLVSRFGDWFTFTEKRGRTLVLPREKLVPELFVTTPGNLRKERITIDRGQHFSIVERTFDTLVSFNYPKKPEEEFSFEELTFEDGIKRLEEFGLVDSNIIEEKLMKHDKAEVVKVTSSMRENIILDRSNRITYRGKDRGQGVVFEVYWTSDGKTIKQKSVETSAEVMKLIEEWIKEYNENNI